MKKFIIYTAFTACSPAIYEQTARVMSSELKMAIILPTVDHNDPSKPSHRLTNGPEPSKTIERDGSNIKKPS